MNRNLKEKKNSRVLFYEITLILAVLWIFNATFDFLFFSEGKTFWDLLLFDIPPHHLVERFLYLGIILFLCLIIQRQISKHERRHIITLESEIKLNTIFQAIPDSFYLISFDGVILEFKGDKKNVDTQPEALVGKKFIDIMSKEIGTMMIDSIKDVLNVVMIIFVMIWIPSLVFKIFHVRLIFVVSLAIMFGLAFVLKKLFDEKLIYVLGGLTVVRIIFDYAYVSTFGFLKQFSYISILIIVIFVLINSSSEFFSKKVNIKKLRPGMILAGKVYDGKKEVKLEHPAEGLTMKDVRKILRLYKNEKIGDNVNICQTIPFAPFMFAGALLTIVLRGDFLISLIKLIP